MVAPQGYEDFTDTSVLVLVILSRIRNQVLLKIYRTMKIEFIHFSLLFTRGYKLSLYFHITLLFVYITTLTIVYRWPIASPPNVRPLLTTSSFQILRVRYIREIYPLHR